MLALQLLDALHGNLQGYRFGVAKEPGNWPAEERHKHTRQAGFTDNLALATWLTLWSAAGWDVYHSCALFRDPKKRKTQVASGARAFWIDLDVGPDKPFATQRDAVAATLRFAEQMKIPTPLFVSSGRGVHAYWLIDRFLDAVTWVGLAARLKQACAQLGLPIDPARTADIASILRPPGTKNWKNASDVFVIGGSWDAHDVRFFQDALSTFEPAERVVGAAPTHAPIAAAMGNIYSYDPADAGAVADGCAQVRLLSDWRDTRATVPEPVWRGILGVLKHCERGSEVAHEWSEGHTAYSQAGTQNKIDRWGAGPTTCAYFGSHNPAACASCPHVGTITSPIQLGRHNRREEAAVEVTKSIDLVTSPTAAPAPIFMPDSFGVGVNGELTCLTEKNNKGEKIAVVVARNLIYLDRVARGEMRDDKHYYVLKHVLPHEGLTSIEISAKEFWGSQGMAALAGKGAVIEDHDLFRLYMRGAVHAQTTARKTGMMYEQCGWKEDDNAFLAGTTLYRAGATEIVRGTPEISYRGRMLGPRDGGSLAEWKRCADELFGLGREAQSFALLASFGATLIRFLSTDEGGAIVSLVSRGSGRGKTTALAGVTSVWGSTRGLQLANADTAVARGLTFGALGNLPVIFDELAARDAEVVRDFVEMFTNGRDKMRGTQDGEIKHTLATWQTILITASNTSLIDTILAEGGSVATTMRVIEVPCALPMDVTRKGDQLKEGLHRNWGYAGDVFMRHLLNPSIMAWTRDMVVRTQQQIIAQHEMRPEHRFWARTIACCAVAGILCTQLKLIDFPVGPILVWVLEHLRDREAGTRANAAGNETALDFLVSFVNEHISETLVCADGWKQGIVQVPRVMPKQRLTLRYNLRPQQLFISEGSLRSYLVKREFAWADFMGELETNGVIAARRRLVNLGAGTDFTSGPQRCVEINCAHPLLGNMPVEIERALPSYTQNNIVPLAGRG